MSTYDQKKQKVGRQFNISVGIPLEEHEGSLKKHEKEIRENLNTAHEAEKNILLKELSELNQKNDSYNKLNHFENFDEILEKVKTWNGNEIKASVGRKFIQNLYIS